MMMRMPHSPLNISVTSSALTSDPRVAPRLAREAGFGGLIYPALNSSLALPDLSATGKREFRHLLSAQQQQLVAIQFDLGSKGFGTGVDVDHLIVQFRRVLEAARDLGALCVCTDLGPLPRSEERLKPKPPISPRQAGLILLPPSVAEIEGSAPPQPAPLTPVEQAFMAQVDSAMVEVCNLLDRYSVTLACSSSLSSFASLERTIAAARCPWLGVDLDPVAILRDGKDIDEIFSDIGGLIRHVRARDATRGADRRTVPSVVGGGSTDWHQLLNNLDSAGYQGWITIDPTELQDRTSAALAGLKTLRSL
jgi:sugar phosphate isomerase/epimerase